MNSTLEKRVSNLELTVQALMSIIMDALPPGAQNNLYALAEEHCFAAIDLDGLPVPYMQGKDGQLEALNNDT